MSDLADFDFRDLAPQSRKVFVGESEYILREPTEDAAVRYKNELARHPKLADGEVASLGDINDAEPFILHLCLWTVAGENKDRERNVPLPVIRGWPSRVVKPLVAWLKEAGGLEDDGSEDGIRKQIAKLEKRLKKLRGEGDDAPKNSPCATTDTSSSPTN